MRRKWLIAACAGSTSRSTRSIRTSSARSRAGAISTRCSAASRRRASGRDAIKINAVALKGVNEDEIESLITWAHGLGMDLTLIEVMPLGEIEPGRIDQFLPLSVVRARLMDRFNLEEDPHRTGGPARYVRGAETGGRDRLHHAADPQFLRELQPGAADLHGHALHVPRPGGRGRSARAAARVRRRRPAATKAIEEAISRKPKGHDFVIDRRRAKPAVGRHMSVTGG
jgi:cyclic pyranopterin phosphate synthase